MRTQEKRNCCIDYEKQRLEIEDFYEVSQILSKSLDLKKTLKVVAESMTKLFNAAYCDIYLIEKGDLARCAFWHGKKAPFHMEYKLEQSVHSKKALLTQEPLEIENPLKYKNYDPQMRDFLKTEDICCLLYLPIINNGQNIGFIRLYRTGGSSLKQLDPKRIMTIVNQVAIAIENSRMHERLNKRKSRWQSIFDDTSDGMVITDENLKVLLVNTAFENIIGKKGSSLKGRTIRSIFSEQGDKLVLEKEIKENLYTLGKKIRKDVLLDGVDRLIWTSMNISITNSSSLNLPRLIFSFEDITEKKEIESTKSEFVSIVSHELRSPLTAMRGYLNLLEKKEFGQLTVKQKHLLKRSIESTERMTGLVENILDVSRIDTGKIDLVSTPVDLNKVINLVVRDLSESLKQKKIRIKNTKKTFSVMGDKDRLYQIFYNLIDNSIKYSFPSGKIEINAEENKDNWVISIHDNGVGINKSEQKRLFSKFSRLNNVLSVSSGGTGLGLYIVKNLVSVHNGDIWIESKEGEGSRFFVSLPKSK